VSEARSGPLTMTWQTTCHVLDREARVVIARYSRVCDDCSWLCDLSIVGCFSKLKMLILLVILKSTKSRWSSNTSNSGLESRIIDDLINFLIRPTLQNTTTDDDQIKRTTIELLYWIFICANCKRYIYTFIRINLVRKYMCFVLMVPKDNINFLTRPNQSAIFQLRTGHSKLNFDLNLFDPCYPPHCRNCTHPYETITHVLFECLGLKENRELLLPHRPSIGNTIRLKGLTSKDCAVLHSIIDFKDSEVFVTKVIEFVNGLHVFLVSKYMDYFVRDCMV